MNQGMWTLCVVWLMVAAPGYATTVAIYKDGRSGNIVGIEATLKAEGMGTKIIGKKQLTAENLQDVDVIYFPGGWNSYQFLGFQGKRLMADFVAHGKGVLAGAFRAGRVRTANRPMFPEVARATNRISSNWVFARGDHPVLKGFPGKLCHRGWDHILMEKGPLGTVFMVDVDELPVGVAGEMFNGRYTALGIYFGGTDNPLEGAERTLFLNCARWLDGAERLEGEALEHSRKRAERRFLCRDRLIDYTRDDRGPDTGPGVMPRVKYDMQTLLDSLKYRLAGMERWLEGQDKVLAIQTCEDVEREIEILERNYQSVLQERMAWVNAADSETLLNDDPEVYAKTLPDRLLPKEDFDAICKRGEAVVARLKAKVDAGKAEQAKKERQADAARVPKLVKQCASSDAAARRRAAQELGRVGDARGIDALIGLIDDADWQARRNAILSLGWLRAKKAVPALTKAAQSDDRWVRRRAVQALGQIGDTSVTKLMLTLIGHDDFYTAENAIFSLGWLKAKEAVTALMTLIGKGNAEDPVEKEKMCAAIRALGHIGDRRALPLLNKLAETAKDFPRDRRVRRIKSILHYRSLGLEGYSKDAIAEIEAGGRKTIGVDQPEYLSLTENFYGLRERYNFFAGRPIPLRWEQFRENHGALLDYITGLGATGVLKGWYATGLDTEGVRELTKGLADRDLRWVPDLPVTTFSPSSKIHKPGCEKLIFWHHDLPALRGFWSEEVYPVVEFTDVQFEAALTDKHGPNFREKLGLGKDVKITVPDNAGRLEHPVLWAEYLDVGGRVVAEDWREAQEWMHGLRKACAFMWSISAPGCMSHLLGLHARISESIHVNGPESYNSHGRDNAFMMDLTRDGEARPVLTEFYNWYCPTVAHAERGFAVSLMHGECFFNFYMAHIFAQAPRTWLWVWEKGRWDAAKRICEKASKLGDYLSPTGSAATVALIYSDRTSQLFYSKAIGDRSGRPRRYYQHQEAAWEMLQQSHLPTDAIWAETLTDEKLSRYNVAVLSDAKSLTNEEIGTVRKWVKNGGVLIATGTTTLFDEWGRKRVDYALADVFGVRYGGNVAKTNPDEIDSFCFVDGTNSCMRIVNEACDPRKILFYVHREVKPARSVGTLSVSQPNAFLPAAGHGFTCEYDMALGYDKLDVKGATVLAAWENGDPAVTVNKIGKGCCYFYSAAYPGLAHTTSGWEMHPLFKDFWPGARELVAAMVRGGLKQTEQTLAATIADGPEQVELTVRTQADKRRWMLHLLNYDPYLDRVRGVDVTVNPPASDNIKVFYGDDKTEIPFVRTGEAITFRTRNFGVHDMIVVQY